MTSLFLLLVYCATAFAQYGKYVCMVQDPDTKRRCGACLERFDCLDPTVLLDCGMSGAYYQEGIDMRTQENCEAYLQAMSSDTSSDAQLQDAKSGVPALAYAITMVVFSSEADKIADNKLNATGSPDCTLKHIAAGGISGRGLQDCMNDKIIEKGESWLEQAACEYVSSGAASAFCKSEVFKAATGVVNSFANKFIEQPLSHAATSIERAATNVVSKAVGWFKGLFHWGKPALLLAGGNVTSTNHSAVIVNTKPADRMNATNLNITMTGNPIGNAIDDLDGCSSVQDDCGSIPRVLFMQYQDNMLECSCTVCPWKVALALLLLVFMCGGFKCLNKKSEETRVVRVIDRARLVDEA